jgi:hypothetical protein
LQVLQWNGAVWKLFESPTTRDLNAVDNGVMVGDFGTVIWFHWSGKLVLDTARVFGPGSPIPYSEHNPQYHINETWPFPTRFEHTSYIDAASDVKLPPIHLYAVTNRGQELFFANEIPGAGAGGDVPTALTVGGVAYNGSAIVLTPDNWHVSSLRFYTGSAYVVFVSFVFEMLAALCLHRMCLRTGIGGTCTRTTR